MCDESLILKWSEETSQGKVAWFLRRVDPSGSFFGEIRYISKQFHRNLSGKIADSDLELLFALVDNIRHIGSGPKVHSEKSSWKGLLATGTPAKPRIILEYYSGDETNSPAARDFLKLITTLRHYVESQHGETGEPAETGT